MAAARRVEVVLGRLSDDRATQLLELWASHRALPADEARKRLHEVVCVLLDGERVVGATSAYAADVPLIGNRRFWMYRRFAPGIDDDTNDRLLCATYEALDDARTKVGPIGLCVVVDESETRRRPLAIWPETQLRHSGYVADGRQLLVRYFTDALVASPLAGARTELPTRDGWAAMFPLAGEYVIQAIDDAETVSGDDVVALWMAQVGMPEAEATRRLAEVMLVATHGGELAGVMTVYLQHNDQLRVDGWYLRALVAEKHQRSSVAVHLAMVGLEELERRFLSGEDVRAVGIITEVENADMRAAFAQAEWPATNSHYIGDNSVGWPVYVGYFPGAHVA